jgi:hypothetical protein
MGGDACSACGVSAADLSLIGTPFDGSLCEPCKTHRCTRCGTDATTLIQPYWTKLERLCGACCERQAEEFDRKKRWPPGDYVGRK